ncbi:MAG: TonB-dependent receptor [bacterium]
MLKKNRIKLNILLILLSIIFTGNIIVYCEEEKDNPVFKLPEEIIMGSEKEKKKSEGKEEIRVEEKYGLKKSSYEKIIPDILLREREENIIRAQKRRGSRSNLDFSLGNFKSINFGINHGRNTGKFNYFLEFDKKTGNRTRSDSDFDYNMFAGELFAEKIDFMMKVNSNKFDLPGGINAPVSGSTRRCDDFGLNFGVKISKNLYFILKGENTNLKEGATLKNESLNLKIIYDFIKNNGQYIFTGEVEENKLENNYDYSFYSFYMENRGIHLNEKSQAKLGAGVSREGDGKLFLNPSLRYYYRHSNITNFEAGLKRQNKKVEFYDLYGQNNFSQVNPAPLKRINYWQLYSNAYMKFSKDLLINAKIFHDWIENFVVFDEDDNNPDGLWIPVNIKSVQRDGAQVSLIRKFTSDITAKLYGKLLSSRNENNNQTVPRQYNSISVLIKYRNPLYILSIDGKYYGESYYDKETNEKLGGYFLLGCLLEKSVSEKLLFYAKAGNILNKKYEIIKHYPGEQTKILLGCKYSF